MARNKEPIDLSTLRYALYARKSTEDEGSQMRSIKDQIDECKKLAKRENLNVVIILEESKSAKKPDNRPVFSQLLNDIESNKYDAILCWHPDRLSRNMLESGKIIDMLDTGVIRDLRFNSHQFSNDANGKMLLGMLFVFSKQYSEDLSEKVRRGIDHNFEEGKSSGFPKWGYNRDAVSGFYRPDDNFEYINQGWEMRLSGSSMEEILQYWRDNNVHRMTKLNRKSLVSRRVDVYKSTATRIFQDPFYYGILEQAEQEVDLRTIYNFNPMIDESIYESVQALGYNRSRTKPQETRGGVFYPFRGMVFCGVCNSTTPMRVGKNKSGSGTYFLSYRCDNKLCTRKVKSVRAKYIMDDLYETLDKLKFTENEYSQYSKHIENYTDESLVEIRTLLRSRKALKTNKENQRKEMSLKLANLGKKSLAYADVNEYLENLQNEIIDLQAEILTLEAKMADPAKIMLSKNEFLNLANSAADKMRAGAAVEKDMLARILLLNLTINNEMVPSYQWREPFADLLKAKSISLGAKSGT
ncbi:MAG: hypothetical protein JWN28_380 [Candidatus Saccharibacteria bacterium]|nr:hypothetical protein [Candidatus Saccharibacteria bacterium]